MHKHRSAADFAVLGAKGRWSAAAGSLPCFAWGEWADQTTRLKVISGLKFCSSDAIKQLLVRVVQNIIMYTEFSLNVQRKAGLDSFH
jgi:hypothetical protein